MKKEFLLSTLFLLSIKFCFSQTQMELNQQTYKEYQSADAEMTKTYKLILSKMTIAKQKQELIETQRAWIKYKESHCKAISNLYEGGSMQPMVQSQCLTEITEQRTKLIKLYFERL